MLLSYWGGLPTATAHGSIAPAFGVCALSWSSVRAYSADWFT